MGPEGTEKPVKIGDGGVWGLARGLQIQLNAWDEGDITTIAAIQAIHDTDTQLRGVEGPARSTLPDKSELTDRIVVLCQTYGYVSDATYDLIDSVIDSITPDPEG